MDIYVCVYIYIYDVQGWKKIMIFLIWNIDIYIDVYIYKLFQTCSIQIDLGTYLNRGYMIFTYIKTLGNVHKASHPVVA